MIAQTSRSLETVFYPADYPPFPGLTSAARFERAWDRNPVWILDLWPRIEKDLQDRCTPAGTPVYVTGLSDDTPAVPGPLWVDRAATAPIL